MSEQTPEEYTEFVKREYRKVEKAFRLMERNIQSGLMKPGCRSQWGIRLQTIS